MKIGNRRGHFRKIAIVSWSVLAYEDSLFFCFKRKKGNKSYTATAMSDHSVSSRSSKYLVTRSSCNVAATKAAVNEKYLLIGQGGAQDVVQQLQGQPAHPFQLWGGK
jgi:hypothetical protein